MIELGQRLEAYTVSNLTNIEVRVQLRLRSNLIRDAVTP
jgi:hypothetical protein